jgi:hypothetical protein
MEDITKHNTEEEGEGNDSKDGRIDFLILRNTIGIDYFLERPCEGISLYVSWSHK